MSLQFYQIDQTSMVPLPFFGSLVPAGFASPANDFTERKLDLNEHLIQHPIATFFVKVDGDSMVGAGIFSGDLLIVDRAQEAVDGKVVLACLDGEFTVKRIKKTNSTVYLVPENPSFEPIEITSERNFQVWGVVTYVIHNPN
jgi:DNA polymerase V